MTGQDLHTKAGHLRESGKFLDSIKLIMDAIYAYQQEENFTGVTDAEGDAVLSFRHLYMSTGDTSYLILALAFANASVETAKEKDLKGDLARPLYNLAKVQSDLGDYNAAIESYKEAIKLFEEENPTLHNRSGVLADMKIHYAIARYKAGDKLAFGDALQAIEDLENSDEKKVSKYNYDVWLSGAHMSLAEMLRGDDMEKAKDHLAKAKKIIDANSELKIRKEQWEKLNMNF